MISHSALSLAKCGHVISSAPFMTSVICATHYGEVLAYIKAFSLKNFQ